ncbi:MAG: hypothetical protein LBR17_03760 [Bacteroidales bacterium]|nr:hypothetical protein [Bacteroidales bacterium]
MNAKRLSTITKQSRGVLHSKLGDKKPYFKIAEKCNGSSKVPFVKILCDFSVTNVNYDNVIMRLYKCKVSK